MRWIYLAIFAVLGIVFWRKDVQLVDLILNANLKWSLAAALFLSGVIAAQFFVGHTPNPNTKRIAFWGVFFGLFARFVGIFCRMAAKNTDCQQRNHRLICRVR